MGDRELSDVTVQNFVGDSLNILHCSDVDPHSVIRMGVANKAKRYAKPITNRQIGGCIALVINAGGGVSKDLSKLMYRLARKPTDSVLSPMPADGGDRNGAAFRLSTGCTPRGDDEDAIVLQTVRIRARFN